MTIDDLKKLDIKELKVMAYDTLARLENEQNNVKILNQIIGEKIHSLPDKQPSIKDALKALPVIPHAVKPVKK